MGSMLIRDGIPGPGCSTSKLCHTLALLLRQRMQRCPTLRILPAAQVLPLVAHRAALPLLRIPPVAVLTPAAACIVLLLVAQAAQMVSHDSLRTS